MKKYLKTVIVYLVVLCCIVYAVNTWYMHKDLTYKDRTEKYSDVPYGIQISCYGGSHEAVGVDFSLLPDEYICFNFADGQQLPLYDVRLMKCYEDHLAEGGTALIGLTFFSLRHRPLEEMSYFESYNKGYYWNLSREYIYRYDLKTDIYVTKLPSLTAGLKLFSVLFQPKPDPRKEAEEAEAYYTKCTTPEEAAIAAVNRYESYIEYHRGYVNRECVDAVYEMIEICRKHNITPILITSPVLQEINDYIHANDPAFFEEFYADIDKICRDTGVTYYNYLEDPRFVYDYSLFMDPDHMNWSGSEKFTEIIAREVLGIDY